MRLGPFLALGLALAGATSAQAETDAGLVGLWAREEGNGWVFSYNFHADGTFEFNTQLSPQPDTVQTTKGTWYIERGMLVTKPKLSTQYKPTGLGTGQLYSWKMPDEERGYTINGDVLMLGNETFFKVKGDRAGIKADLSPEEKQKMEAAIAKGIRDFENLSPEEKQKWRDAAKQMEQQIKTLSDMFKK